MSIQVKKLSPLLLYSSSFGSTKMSITILFAALAMLTMVNAAPVQEEQNNFQGLLDVLADQKTKESTAQTAGSNIVKQQQQGGDDDGSMQELQGLLKSLANVQQDDDSSANAQFNWHSFARGLLDWLPSTMQTNSKMTMEVKPMPSFLANSIAFGGS